MAIVGTTVGEDGKPILRLPVTRKIACGIGPSAQRNHPERLFKFLLMKRGSAKEWIMDQAAMAKYNPKCNHEDVTEQCENCCTEIKLMLVSDPIYDGRGNLDIEDILRTSLVWWGKTGWKCRGDGVNAIRRTEAKPDGEPWSPCKIAGCPDWDESCSASGDLYGMLSDEQGFGFARIHTASERSIKNLNSALLYICSRTGNRLAGVTIPIKVTKEKATPIDKKTGMAMETWVPILSVGGSFDKIIEDSMETLKAYEETRKLFAGKVPRPYEEEADRAAEIPAEFPNKSEPKALPEAPESAKATEPPPPAEKAAPAAATPPPQASQPASEKPKSEKPKVAKLAVKFHGMPKAMTENAIASGPNKGKPFWKLTLEAAGGDVTLLVFSSTVREKIDGAIKRSQEVELDCESHVRAENSFTKVNDVAFLTKAAEPEPAGEEPPADWMLD